MKNVLAKNLTNSNKIVNKKSKKIMNTKNNQPFETKPDKGNNIQNNIIDSGNFDNIESTRSNFSLNGFKRNSNLSEASNESSGQHQIKVIVRFRPHNEAEQKRKEKCVDVMDNINVKVSDEGGAFHNFTFDKVFDLESTQEEVYEEVKSTIEDVLKGYNGTIFAYGQSGSGKTYTMKGADINDDNSKGIIPRALTQIFDYIESENNKENNDIEFELRVSVLEIYLEKLYDLLNADEGSSKLDIKSTPNGTVVKGLIEQCVNDEEEMLSIFDEAEKRREVDTTSLNKTSSRSHLVFRLEIRQKHKYDDIEKRGVLNLVDLAGSEKVKQSNTSGKTLEEAKKINLSLLYLGTVIEELSSQKSFVSYHSSKLTSLLKDSLGGNYKTTIIINCSPCIYNVAETLSSLRFAQRAKKIKNKVKLNIKLSNDQYEKVIQQLMNQLKAANEEIRRLGGQAIEFDNYGLKMNSKENEFNPNHDKLMKEKDDELFRLKDNIDQLTSENLEIKNLIEIYKNQANSDLFIVNLENTITKTINELKSFSIEVTNNENEHLKLENSNLKEKYDTLEAKFLCSAMEINDILTRDLVFNDKDKLNNIDNMFVNFFDSLENFSYDKKNSYKILYTKSQCYLNRIVKDFIFRKDIYNQNFKDVSEESRYTHLRSEYTKLNLILVYYEKIIFNLMNRVLMDVSRFQYEYNLRIKLEDRSLELTKILYKYLDLLNEIKLTKHKSGDNKETFVSILKRRTGNILKKITKRTKSIKECSFNSNFLKQIANKIEEISLDNDSPFRKMLSRKISQTIRNTNELQEIPENQNSEVLDLFKKSIVEVVDEEDNESKLLRKENSFYKNSIEFLRNELDNYRDNRIDNNNIINSFIQNQNTLFEKEVENMQLAINTMRLFYEESICNNQLTERNSKIKNSDKLLEDDNFRGFYEMKKTNLKNTAIKLSDKLKNVSGSATKKVEYILMKSQDNIEEYTIKIDSGLNNKLPFKSPLIREMSFTPIGDRYSQVNSESEDS